MTTTTNNEHKKLNVPNLRFPEFQGEWEKMRLDAFTERVMRKNKNNLSQLPLTISAQYGLVDQVTFFNKVIASTDMSNYYLLKKGEFAYNKSYSSDYPWGAIKRLDRYDQGALSSLYICFALQDSIVSDYVLQYFESPKWHKGVSEIAVEGARNHGLLNVSVQDFFHTYHYVPKEKEEQIKIGKFLALLDERIATQNKVIEDFEKLKCAIIETEYNGKGHECRIGDIIEQTSLRNKNNLVKTVLSVNNKLGFINQEEQFEDRAVASEDTSNYKVVTKDDFAYNPARINVGSIARLKSFNKGIVSPMYICFKVTDGIVPEYLESYFTTNRFFKEMQKRLEGSVRLCLSFEGLCNIPISIPCMDEQVEIGKRICQIENMIETEYNILSLYEKQKLYLLRQMLI